MKYKVPVSWQMYGHVTVEADTLEHAAKIAIGIRHGYWLA